MAQRSASDTGSCSLKRARAKHAGEKPEVIRSRANSPAKAASGTASALAMVRRVAPRSARAPVLRCTVRSLARAGSGSGSAAPAAAAAPRKAAAAGLRRSRGRSISNGIQPGVPVWKFTSPLSASSALLSPAKAGLLVARATAKRSSRPSRARAARPHSTRVDLSSASVLWRGAVAVKRSMLMRMPDGSVSALRTGGALLPTTLAAVTVSLAAIPNARRVRDSSRAIDASLCLMENAVGATPMALAAASNSSTGLADSGTVSLTLAPSILTRNNETPASPPGAGGRTGPGLPESGT
mmetsp:Transcript_22568/g.85496  ORF Transcript_22568/g.85496 Transcript_22568/m.85496 type:complete len:296 (-) Transcript_22568:745-1632(-)